MPESVFEYYLKIHKSELGPKGTNHSYFNELINDLGVWRSELVGHKISLLGDFYYVRLDFVHPQLPDPCGIPAEWNFGKSCYVTITEG